MHVKEFIYTKAAKPQLVNLLIFRNGYTRFRRQHGYYSFPQQVVQVELLPYHERSELQYKPYKQVYFSYCLKIVSTATSHRLKKNNFRCRHLNHQDLLAIPYLNHIQPSRFELLIILNIVLIPKKYIWRCTSFKL